MNLDFVSLAGRVIGALLVLAFLAWLGWKLTASYREARRSRRVRPDRRRRKVRVAHDRRKGPRRAKDAERAEMEKAVQTLESPGRSPSPRK